ncbi:MAG TPA: S49 family peptidase, partial [Alphaproteobacteria bacterium]|nr:S49 family peptidase [Alphaproteobacteria bacterium]
LFRTTEFSGLLDKLGINAESLKSSPLKGEPSPFQPMSKEARAALRAVLDDSYQWFRDLVRRRRGLEGERLAAVADGRVFTGRQALDNGLIDALGGEEAARHWLASSRGVPESLPTVDVHWGEGPPLVNQLVGSLSEKLFSAERLRLDGLLSLWHPE